MAKFIKKTVKAKSVVIYNTSDWHVGSRAFNDAAARTLVERVADEGAYLTFGGDAVEGKVTKSSHFDPKGLNDGEITIQDQCNAFVDILRPIAKRVLMVQTGNHEVYLKPDFDVIDYICRCLGTDDIYGHYQTWLELNGCTMHFWHGKPAMPRGAKDPIQREANQRAWLKRKFEELAGSAQAHYMGHTHHCLIQPPLDKYALLNGGNDVHGVYFKEPMRDVNGMEYWHPDARWYVNTGTLRRGGRFNYEDYSEIAGYNPPAISCTKTTIVGDSIENIEKVML